MVVGTPATRDKNFLKAHIHAIKIDDDKMIFSEDKIERYVDKLSAEKVKKFCTNIRAFVKALRVTGEMTVYDSGTEGAYAGMIGPKFKNFCIEWSGKKKLCILTY